MPCGELNFQLAIPILNGYLMILSVLRLHSFDDRMNIKQLMELGLAGETEVLRENPPNCHSAHHKSHMS
jgi:hypothetical protein